MHLELHRHLSRLEYLQRHLDQNLAGFHNRLKYHRRLYLDQHYRPYRPSLDLPIRLHH